MSERMYPAIFSTNLCQAIILPTPPFVKPGYRGEWVVSLRGVSMSNAELIIAWCKETFGEQGIDRKRYRWKLQNIGRHKLFLRHESDVMLFNLKWQ